MSKLFYRVVEAEGVTGVSRGTLYRKIRAGEIEARRIGRTLLIPAAVVEQLGCLLVTPRTHADVEAGRS